MSAEFCDTNILVYAYDASHPVKHARARALVQRLWDEQSGCISVQVLQELFVTLTHKVAAPVDRTVARHIIADLSTWNVVSPNPIDVLDAIDSSSRWQLSFWDAMIVTAALRAGADLLWSEDLNEGQRFGRLEIRNPLRATQA